MLICPVAIFIVYTFLARDDFIPHNHIIFTIVIVANFVLDRDTMSLAASHLHL